MFTNVGRFWLAVPSAYDTQLPKVGWSNCRPRWPVRGLDDRRKMIALVAPHRAHDGDLVDHAADVREPVRNRNARLAVPRERALAGDDRPLHLRQVVAESDGVDQFAGPLVVLGIERVDVADAAAHEQENDRLGLGREVRAEAQLRDLAGLRPQRAQRQAEKAAAGLVEKTAAGEMRPQG